MKRLAASLTLFAALLAPSVAQGHHRTTEFYKASNVRLVVKPESARYLPYAKCPFGIWSIRSFKGKAGWRAYRTEDDHRRVRHSIGFVGNRAFDNGHNFSVYLIATCDEDG